MTQRTNFVNYVYTYRIDSDHVGFSSPEPLVEFMSQLADRAEDSRDELADSPRADSTN